MDLHWHYHHPSYSCYLWPSWTFQIRSIPSQRFWNCHLLSNQGDYKALRTCFPWFIGLFQLSWQRLRTCCLRLEDGKFWCPWAVGLFESLWEGIWIAWLCNDLVCCLTAHSNDHSTNSSSAASSSNRTSMRRLGNLSSYDQGRSNWV